MANETGKFTRMGTPTVMTVEAANDYMADLMTAIEAFNCLGDMFENNAEYESLAKSYNVDLQSLMLFAASLCKDEVRKTQAIVNNVHFVRDENNSEWRINISDESYLRK